MGQWVSQFQVGVSTIDDQHRTLISLLGEFGKAIEYGRDRQLVLKLLEVIENTAFHHFALEEGLLRDHPERDQHALEHYRMLKDIRQLRILLNGAQRTKRPLEGWVLDDLMAHILSRDIPVFRPVQTAPVIKKVLPATVTAPVARERRRDRRIGRARFNDGVLVATCYTLPSREKRSSRVLNVSIGGMGLESRMGYGIGDLLEIQCKIGRNFLLQERVRVVYARGQVYGAEFVQLSSAARDFLVRLAGATS